MNAPCGAAIEGDSPYERGANFQAHLNRCQLDACAQARKNEIDQAASWFSRRKR